jgi:16S rRNA (guanine527-N7)-methyltransferase
VLAASTRRQLTALIEEARERGLVGPGPVEPHLEHAEALATVVDAQFGGRFLDLGSGAGVPGLVLLAIWPSATGTLLDSQRRRCVFLEQAARELGLGGRASIACGRAEELARRQDLRSAYELVVARAFGTPATTAECAVGFLEAGGRLVVSEPPGPTDPERWPAQGLAELGFTGPRIRGGERGRFAILTADAAAGERWPRRVGVPRRRPLW